MVLDEVQAWSLGLAAGVLTLSQADNPFPPRSDLFEDWCDGWREGQRRRHQQPDFEAHLVH